MVGGSIGPFLGQFNARHSGHGPVEHALQLAQGRQAHHQPLQVTAFGLGFGAGVHIAGIGHGLHNGTQPCSRRCHGNVDMQLFDLGRFQQRHRPSHRLAHVSGRALSDTGQHQAACCHAVWPVEVQVFTRLGVNIAGFEGLGKQR